MQTNDGLKLNRDTTVPADRSAADSGRLIAFAAALEDQILEIERAHRHSGEERWRAAVRTLIGAAMEAGADRIGATATTLLTSRDLHPQCVVLLLGQLRSEGRVLALEQAALGDERSFAVELKSTWIAQERKRS